MCFGSLWCGLLSLGADSLLQKGLNLKDPCGIVLWGKAEVGGSQEQSVFPILPAQSLNFTSRAARARRASEARRLHQVRDTAGEMRNVRRAEQAPSFRVTRERLSKERDISKEEAHLLKVRSLILPQSRGNSE